MLRSFLILFILLNAGCGGIHATEALLLEDVGNRIFEPKRSDGTGRLYGNNVVFVAKDSIFSVDLVQLSAGWIHPGKSVSVPNRDTAEGWGKDERDHIKGKELWILTTIESLDTADPLEIKKKAFFKASNVKLGSESFTDIPIDMDEAKLFAHESDTAYRFTIRIYEVDHFFIKRGLVKAYKGSPGLQGLAQTGWATLKGFLGATGGQIITDWLDKSKEEQLFLERVLLESDAELEFVSRFTVLRDKEPGKSKVEVKEYLLYDLFKSENWDYSHSDKAKYQAAQKKRSDLKVDLSKPNPERCYVLMSVSQAKKVKPGVALVEADADTVEFLSQTLD